MSGCTWSQNGDGAWDTACANVFEFTTDGPVENGFRWCPYCGNPIRPRSEPGLSDIQHSVSRDFGFTSAWSIPYTRPVCSCGWSGAQVPNDDPHIDELVDGQVRGHIDAIRAARRYASG